MKVKFFLATSFALTAFSSQAALIQKIERYLHVPSNMVVELDQINTRTGTATYFNYATNRRVSVHLSDVSKETKASQNGISRGDYIFTYTDQGAQICKTWLVFENGKAQLGCRTGKTFNLGGPTRMEIGSYIGDSKDLASSVKEAHGFSAGETVLLKDKKMKIKEIFESGYALLISANFFTKLDTTESIMKTSTQIVHVNELQKL